MRALSLSLSHSLFEYRSHLLEERAKALSLARERARVEPTNDRQTPPGEAHFAVAIRSALVSPRAKSVFAFAAAGLVRGSNPADEWAEVDDKLSPIDAALKSLSEGPHPKATL